MAQVCDVLYPDTIEAGEGGEDDDDVDLEEMLKRELEGIKKQKKSNRFSKPRVLLGEWTNG